MRKIADFDLAFTLGHLILKQWVITLMTVVPWVLPDCVLHRNQANGSSRFSSRHILMRSSPALFNGNKTFDDI